MIDELWDKIMGGPERRAKVEEVAETINIPSQPKVMQDINLEFIKKNVDFGRIGELISRDVGLSAKILKVANSPLFAHSSPIDSIDHALMMLGAKQFKQTILASALRQAIEGKVPASEEFWHHTESMGLICDAIARKFQPDLVEYSYMTGLFHDCAVPVLMGRSPEFKRLVPRILGRDRLVAQEEEAECEIEHGSLGLVMTRSWSIPIPIVKVVRAHHSDDFLDHDDELATRLHVILAIAENYFLYSRNFEDELFGTAARNPELFAAIDDATGWNESQVLRLTDSLDARFKIA